MTEVWARAVLLERLGGRVEGLRVLEVGCGRGVGTEIIVERFGAASVDAFDLDPGMAEKARRRLSPPRASGSASASGTPRPSTPRARPTTPSSTSGSSHNVPNWRQALAEIGRVLRPGGRFFFEEVTSHALARWSYRTFLEHPKPDRFSAAQFVAELEGQGIEVGSSFVTRFFGDFVIGVGHQRGQAGPDPLEV